MIEWSEEDIQFLVRSLITPLVEKLSERDEISDKTYKNMFDMIVDCITDLQYEAIKDRSFVLAYLGAITGSGKHVREEYNSFSEEFDKLNKSLLDVKEK